MTSRIIRCCSWTLLRRSISCLWAAKVSSSNWLSLITSRMLRLILVNLRSITLDLLSSLPSSESEEDESPLSLPSLPEKQETVLFPLYDLFNIVTRSGMKQTVLINFLYYLKTGKGTVSTLLSFDILTSLHPPRWQKPYLSSMCTGFTVTIMRSVNKTSHMSYGCCNITYASKYIELVVLTSRT